MVLVATMAPMAPLTSMATMVQNLVMTAASTTMVPMAPMVSMAIVIATTYRIAICMAVKYGKNWPKNTEYYVSGKNTFTTVTFRPFLVCSLFKI